MDAGCCPGTEERVILFSYYLKIFHFEIISELQSSYKEFPCTPHPAPLNVNIFHSHGTVIKTKKSTSIQTSNHSLDFTEILHTVPLTFFFWSGVQSRVFRLFQPIPSGWASLLCQVFVSPAAQQAETRESAAPTSSHPPPGVWYLSLACSWCPFPRFSHGLSLTSWKCHLLKEAFRD